MATFNPYNDPILGSLYRQADRNRSQAHYNATQTNIDPLANFFTVPVNGKDVDIRYLTKNDMKNIGYRK